MLCYLYSYLIHGPRPPTSRRANSMDPVRVRVYCYTYIRPDPRGPYTISHTCTAHETNQSMPKMWGKNHRVHTEWQRPPSILYSIIMVKSVRVGVARPPPFTLSIITSKGLGCTLQLRGQIHWPCFISCIDMYSVDRTESLVLYKLLSLYAPQYAVLYQL